MPGTVSSLSLSLSVALHSPWMLNSCWRKEREEQQQKKKQEKKAGGRRERGVSVVRCIDRYMHRSDVIETETDRRN